MPNPIIKTHRKNAPCRDNQIYILNKELNSGKPQKNPYTNSFVITFSSKEEAENVYWLIYSLWKANFWHQYLCGSVIPFLRIHEFKKNFIPKLNSMLNNLEQHEKQIKALQIIEIKERQFQESLLLIEQMRKTILSHYFKK
ncbi:DUF6943 family protein [Flavobacterium hiemivividum]|uniref:Type I restriction modification DNA specificity domain-containing protein n=1 Tax=Flavobacterium hiemivividum TaxID=2541734 RepID=A0A4R5CR14_9FLAO|nr:hypothetical protein [Flavobacterium hiemivividum]TDE01907.1 hypothetical protein E0F98_13805 [Flavobacterium hiemivividum]